MNVVLTGRPGIGKTTIIETVAEVLGPRAGGIITREIRDRGRRTGFSIASLDGETRLLATKQRKGGPRVGPYTVLVESLDDLGVKELGRALAEKEVLIIDEIGKMELISKAFRNMILRVLDCEVTTLATLSVARDPFMEAVRRRGDVHVIEVTEHNRDGLPARIIQLIDQARVGRGGETHDETSRS